MIVLGEKGGKNEKCEYETCTTHILFTCATFELPKLKNKLNQHDECDWNRTVMMMISTTNTNIHEPEHCTQNSHTYASPIHEIVRRLLSIDRNANAENCIHLPIDMNWLL